MRGGAVLKFLTGVIMTGRRATTPVGRYSRCDSEELSEARVATRHSYTGRMCAASRYLESQRTDAMFQDPLAYKLAGAEGRKAPMGEWILVPRTVYGDNVLSWRYQHQQVRQLVLLGAGMDARAWRLDLPELRVFEVDQPTTFDVKEPLVADETLTVKSRVVVSTDFSNSDKWHGTAQWADDLLYSGFDPDVPTVWLLEGLVMYLYDDDMELVMRKIGELTSANAIGSAVFHDAISRSYVKTGVSVAGAKFVGSSDDYARLWADVAGFQKSYVSDMNAISLDRENRRLYFDRRVPEATPSRCYGRNVVLFVEAEKV